MEDITVKKVCSQSENPADFVTIVSDSLDRLVKVNEIGEHTKSVKVEGKTIIGKIEYNG